MLSGVRGATMRAMVGVVMAAVLCLGLAGCSKEETPQEAVLAQYQRGETAIESKDIMELRNTMTHESWASLNEVLRHARETPEKGVRALPPQQMRYVLLLRNRLDPARLNSMVAEDFVAWLIESEIWIVDAAQGVFPMDVKVKLDSAQLQMGEEIITEGKRTRMGRGAVRALSGVISKAATTKRELKPIEHFVLEFKNLNGYWYRDLPAEQASNTAYIMKYAKEFKLSVVELILVTEEDQFGSLKPNLWEPSKP